jgi:hypothetical protein
LLAAKWAAFSKHLRTSSSCAFASLPVFDYVQRINHLQWGGVVTKQRFRSRHTVLTFLANGPRGTWAGREANRYGDFD